MKRFSTILTLLTLTLVALAQQVSFEALPPRGVARQGDKFALTFRLNNANANAPQNPQVDGCTFIFGPSTSTRQSYSVVNGAVTQSSSIDYSYTYRADREGTVTVPAVTVSVNGKPYSSKPFKINVVKGGQAAQGSQGGRQAPVDMYDPSTQSAGRDVGANDVFVRINLSKSQAYEQEAIVCTIKLYTKYQISSFMPTQQPSFDGFLTQEIDLQPTLNEAETLNGQTYMTAVLKRCILFPQHAGKLTINSGNYNITVVQYERVNMGIMSVSNPVERQIKVSSNKASIDIKPLPTPKPEGFSGAVGTFSADSRIIGNTFKTGDAATMIYTIKGTGNIKYLKEPKIDFPDEFELYEPQSEIESHVNGNNITGTMTVNYTFVPQAVGDFKIGSDKFVYFDPSTSKYVTIDTPGYNIKVSAGNNSNASAQQVESKNTDILHIRTSDKHPSQTHTLVVDTVWYWLIYVGGVLALCLVVWLNRRHMRMSADVVGTRMARAGKEARRRLKAANAFMAKGDSEHFYEAVLQAIWGFLSDRLNMPASQLSRDNVNGELERYGIDADTRNRLMHVLDDCEMARYAPVGGAEGMSNIYNEASSIINTIASASKSHKK